VNCNCFEKLGAGHNCAYNAVMPVTLYMITPCLECLHIFPTSLLTTIAT